MKPKKHVAEQTVSQVIDPPVKLSLTLALEGDYGRLWRRYCDHHAALRPSASQMARSLIEAGLESWKAR